MKLIRKTFEIQPVNILRRAIPLLSLIAMVAVLVSPAVYADAASDAAKKQAYDKSMDQTRKHLHEVEQKLTNIQKDTIASYPKLQKQEADFRAMLMATMSTKDYDANKEMKELTDLQAQLMKKDIDRKEKRKMFREFLQRKSRFQQAQTKAFADPKVKKAQTALQDAMEKAMKDKHPETQSLLDDLEKTRKKFAEMERNAP